MTIPPEGIRVYHGTSKENARSIKENGPRFDLDNNNLYGPGFYVTKNQERAANYGGDDGEVLEFMLHPKNLSTLPVHGEYKSIHPTVPPEHDARALGSSEWKDDLQDDYTVLKPSAITFLGSRNIADIRRERRKS